MKLWKKYQEPRNEIVDDEQHPWVRLIKSTRSHNRNEETYRIYSNDAIPVNSLIRITIRKTKDDLPFVDKCICDFEDGMPVITFTNQTLSHIHDSVFSIIVDPKDENKFLIENENLLEAIIDKTEFLRRLQYRVSANYFGKTCMTKPIVVRKSDKNGIEKVISVALSDFISRRFEVGKEIKLLNIKPIFENVTVDDLVNFRRCASIISIDGKSFLNTDEAMKYFAEHYGKLVMYYECED